MKKRKGYFVDPFVVAGLVVTVVSSGWSLMIGHHANVINKGNTPTTNVYVSKQNTTIQTTIKGTPGEVNIIPQQIP